MVIAVNLRIISFPSKLNDRRTLDCALIEVKQLVTRSTGHVGGVRRCSIGVDGLSLRPSSSSFAVEKVAASPTPAY
jgi:hypothetical protein